MDETEKTVADTPPAHHGAPEFPPYESPPAMPLSPAPRPRPSSIGTQAPPAGDLGGRECSSFGERNKR